MIEVEATVWCKYDDVLQRWVARSEMFEAVEGRGFTPMDAVGQLQEGILQYLKMSGNITPTAIQFVPAKQIEIYS